MENNTKYRDEKNDIAKEILKCKNLLITEEKFIKYYNSY